MFSKSKETEPVAVVPPPAPPPVKRATTTRNGGVPSIISAELIVRGTLISAGDVQVDGKVDGDIRAAGLVIGDKATITGDIYADEATVRGRVEGSIRARKVQLCATCHVEGNILHEALSVESGAFFEGNCRHSDNPLADAPDAASVTERKSATASSPSRPPQPAPAAAPASTPAE
ncbi:MAG TPA: polymer-forming cytoskeletal protein [Micropepsaceae bacterium]|jgi:cytoskeletal protein CcmA (bactofilin family)